MAGPKDGEKMDSVYTPRRYAVPESDASGYLAVSRVSRVVLNPSFLRPARTLYPSSKSNAGFAECLHHSGFEGALLPSRGIPQFKRVEFHVGGI